MHWDSFAILIFKAPLAASKFSRSINLASSFILISQVMHVICGNISEKCLCNILKDMAEYLKLMLFKTKKYKHT